MKKIIGFLVVLLLLIIVLIFFARKPTPSTPNQKKVQPQTATTTPQEKPLTGEELPFDVALPREYKIGIFAKDVTGARDLEFSPKGTLVVSEKEQGRVVALPDIDRNGIADKEVVLLRNLQNPHGIAFHNGKLFVAEETKVTRYSYNEESIAATVDKKILDLPRGGLHTTRSLLFDMNGKLFISIGSTCNVCTEKNSQLATVIATDSDGQSPKVYSSGLRNAVFLTLSKRNQIYVTEMGRDYLGDNTPPDEIDILSENGNYGWPYCYGNKIPDTSFSKQSSGFCKESLTPFFEFPAHSAPLGITFINSSQFPTDWQEDLLVSFHGSWNRSTKTGYKIVHITTKGTPKMSDFLTGFLDGNITIGRPVDIIFDKQGSIFISDDKANRVYKIVKR
jgi:glucose/arabinose dehydrogenase